VYALVVAVLLAPWAVYVQTFEGLRAYVASGLEFSLREAEASALRTYPRFAFDGPLLSEGNSEAWMLGVVIGVPLFCALLALWRAARRRQAWAGESAAIVAISLLALLADRGFIRDPLAMRLPDAGVLPGLLGGWALAVAFRRPASVTVWRVLGTSAAAAVFVVSAAATWRLGNVTEMLDRAGALDSTEAVVSNLHEVIDELGRNERTAQWSPSRFAAALAPFFDYVESCTEPDDRLLVTGQHPDVYLAARRGFAGGQIAFMQGFYTSADEQARTLARLRHESVPFLLLAIDRQSMFEHDFAEVWHYVDTAYTTLFDLDVPDTSGVRVMVRRDRVPSGTYAGVGWPCYR
jgi:hypothetical protein